MKQFRRSGNGIGQSSAIRAINYLFIQTEYVNFPEQRKETAARSCSAVSFCPSAKISENHENLQFPC